MFSRTATFRLASAALALCLTIDARAAGQSDPLPEGDLLFDAESVRTSERDQRDDAAPDPFGRSRGGFDLGAINPALRLEYGSASRGFVDMNAQIDGYSANERAELGLASRDPGQVYDTTLRFDAARIRELSIFVSSGLRSETAGDAAGDSNSSLDTLRWTPVVGGGLEWRPGRSFYLSGSTLFNSDSDRGSIAEITAELGMRVTPDLSVSLGYRTLDSNFRAPSDAAEELRDAAFAAIRLRF